MIENQRTDQDIAEALRAGIPEQGLFDSKDWRISPEPFWVDAPFVDELEKLGYRLWKFVRACNLLYHLSTIGRMPGWVAEIMDRGKPPELVELGRCKRFREEIPLVLRPDLILTEEGFAVSELDSVPGGIGLTAWLNRQYGGMEYPVLGGTDGMVEGFRSIMPHGGEIVVSEESKTYRPEMEYLAGVLSREGKYAVQDASRTTGGWSGQVYRFFELFDLTNVPASAGLIESAKAGQIAMTPPFKPFLEEKAWFAFFWMKPLEAFWQRELGTRTFQALQKVIPRTWLLDPAPLPTNAVYPWLEIQNWDSLKHFTKKQRELVIKISGFSEKAWGARGVEVGHDISQADWARAIDDALAAFEHHPHILQQFRVGRLVDSKYWDFEERKLISMQGRVRLCPYYFVNQSETKLGGALATICPSDKKLLHGMRDAILVPTAAKGGRGERDH